jgi:hypothetical protein
MTHRLVPAVMTLAALGIALPTAPVAAAPAHPLGGKAAAASCTGSRTDVDGDGRSDVVIPVPSEHSRAGAVDLHLTSAPPVRLTRGSIAGFGQATAGDEFGAAVSSGNVDQDSCADLVVGAPGEGGAGAVHVVFGDPSGVRRSGGLTIHAPDARTGDRFGAAVALADEDLWIGAPGRSVNGHPAAGAVYHYALDVSDAGVVSPRLVQIVTQATPMVAGAPEAGDRFGQVISATLTLVVIGIPSEDVGDRRDAGMVQVLRTPVDRATFSTTGRITAAQGWTQDSPGVPGVAETGDRLGASVTAGWVAAGIPGEGIGRRAGAGAVQVFGRAKTEVGVEPTRFITQGYQLPSGKIGGYPEAGDHFGAALIQGWGFLGQAETDDLAVGAPGEDIGAYRDAGAVSVFEVTADCSYCAPRMYYNGHGLPGSLATGTRVGASVSTTTGAVLEDDGYVPVDNVVTGAPGASLAGTSGVGVVYRHGGGTYLPLADPRRGLGYGSTLGTHEPTN